ncbi:hypothetical protein DFJ43DRAFT_1042239 [Lentinula guzmanii]|uniref:Uncharacterized protein n=1 Tax=Lentinula guzmanii TaxID=2804957 RepID=A0AA38MRY5_9AGAR|nr:hypothetical protein DFJ43DRAFT_1042239 [Lentinula guzmanii]
MRSNKNKCWISRRIAGSGHENKINIERDDADEDDNDNEDDEDEDNEDQNPTESSFQARLFRTPLKGRRRDRKGKGKTKLCMDEDFIAHTQVPCLFDPLCVGHTRLG